LIDIVWHITHVDRQAKSSL